MSLIRTTPDTRPTRRHYRPEPPAPHQLAAYRCDRGHRFELTFAAGCELPQAVDCRCGASAHRAGSTTESANAVAADNEHGRRMSQVRERRTLPELEQLLRDRLAELAAMRKAGQP